MASPFDARALAGRSFGSVLDGIAPGWDCLGFIETGPASVPMAERTYSGAEIEATAAAAAAVKYRFAPLLAALQSRAVVIVDAAGIEIPQSVWLAGRWTLYRDERGVERLVDRDAQGRLVEYFNPRFAGARREKPSRRGRPPDPDAGWIKKGHALIRAGKARSHKQAAEMLFDAMPEAAQKQLGAQRGTFVDRIRRKLGRN